MGDALGFVVEGYGQAVCEDYVAKVVSEGKTAQNLRLPQFSFGQYSDDTQLSREYMISIVQNEGIIDPLVYGLRIAMLFQEKAYRVVGYGLQTARAAAQLWNGVGYRNSGSVKGNGNGSIMRSAPIGVTLKNADVFRAARVLSSITHASENCQNMSVVIARAARYAMKSRGVPWNNCEFFGYIVEGIPDGNVLRFVHKVRDYVLTGDKCYNNWKDVGKDIVSSAIAEGEKEWPGGVSYGVLQTGAWALWSVCSSPDDFMKSMCMAIAVGGDVDSIAAIVGGIVGARVGENGIPKVWRDSLHDRNLYTNDNEWTGAELRTMACKLAEFVKNEKVSLKDSNAS